MAKSARTNAEEQFAKIRLREKEALKERETAERTRSEKVDRLRALRLAKEAADRDAAVLAASQKTAKAAARTAARTKKSAG